VVRAHRLDPPDAEDVYQTTWLRLTQHLGRIKEPDRLGGWLAATARNEALRTLRLRWRIVPVDDVDLLGRPADQATPESAVLAAEHASDRAERLRRVWEAFQALPERCRRLLRLLMAAPPPSYVEISAALGIAVGSIGPTRARCLAQLRERLAGVAANGSAVAGEIP
jgi:RNA polymerase sigma factor (sigma-70 family)